MTDTRRAMRNRRRWQTHRVCAISALVDSNGSELRQLHRHTSTNNPECTFHLIRDAHKVNDATEIKANCSNDKIDYYSCVYHRFESCHVKIRAVYKNVIFFVSNISAEKRQNLP